MDLRTGGSASLELQTATAPQSKRYSSKSLYRQFLPHHKVHFLESQIRRISVPSLAVQDLAASKRKVKSLPSRDTAAPAPIVRAFADPAESADMSGQADGTDGEPVIQDFADKFIPKEFQPDRSQSRERPMAGNGPPHEHQVLEDDDEDDDVPGLSSFAPAAVHDWRQPSISSANTTGESQERSLYADKSSYAESVKSYDTGLSSVPGKELPPLQTRPSDNVNHLSPLVEDDPASFDLVTGIHNEPMTYSLERRSEQLFSHDHLKEIFSRPPWLLHFTTFLSRHRPHAVPLLVYYLDSLKALKAITYANAIAEALEPLEGHTFTDVPARPTLNTVLETKAEAAFDALVHEELPAYITHIFIQYASLSIQRKINGAMPAHLRDVSEGLAEVFCLTDPSRPDNPIVFASEEFHRTTQYGVSYAIGRNCRFLQGPKTNPFSTARLRKAVAEQRELSECFLNYRRDGSPFMNLLMIAPLFDSRGSLRYFIGAQVDVSGLVKECTDLEALQNMLARQDAVAAGSEEEVQESKDEFQDLSEMFNAAELDIARRHGGKMHKEQIEEWPESNLKHPRILLKEPSPDLAKTSFDFQKMGGRLEGIYRNYLLVRPYPSLRILFASPSLRIPGMMQSPFLSRIGGSTRVRDELTAALAAGRGVTAKVRWISSPVGPRYNSHNSESTSALLAELQEGRKRWIHCTPLLGHNGVVGVWMIVVVDEEGTGGDFQSTRRRVKVAPPVSSDIKAERARAKPGQRPLSFGSLAESEQPESRGSGVGSVRSSTAVDMAGKAGMNGSSTNVGAFAEWERKVASGEAEGGSLRSFGI